MIRNVWSVLCRDIITDQDSNAVSYIRCLEEGAATRLPVQIGPLFLATLWEKTGEQAETVQFQVLLVTPSQSRQTILQTQALVLDRPRQRLHFRINALNLNEFGTYMLVVMFTAAEEWETASQLPVFIHQIQPPGAVPPT